jgi:hypothetical protein
MERRFMIAFLTAARCRVPRVSAEKKVTPVTA